ncbi:glycosyltransferase family 4 protein [Marinomonas algicola]|uniref:glycosyltransferase family 4 protein n=1 Tax=Marinomonas algicola TaxID=2773454 RepID=UPI00174DDD83|nr:glycosyltransferase family 1 protein [Marinomonas algicola]
MRIWVDGQCFQTSSNIRGIGRYVIDFIRELSINDIEIIISLNGSIQQEAISACNYLKGCIPNIIVKIWYGTTHSPESIAGYTLERMLDEEILTAHVNAIKPDIALSASPFEGVSDHTSPFIKVKNLVNIKTICIFYDAIPYRFPDTYLQNLNTKKSYLRRLDELENFDTVLCISDFTKNEYIDIFNKTNCTTISAGISNEFNQLINEWVYDENSIGALLNRYIVYVGGLDWRKNIPCLIEAMAHLPECQSGKLKIILVGSFSDIHIQPLRDIFDGYNIPQECLVTTGYIEDNELIDIYKNALVAVQPSRMEGFGLGALEAMACGTPFISAFGGAVAEVVQNEEQMFDPDSSDSLTKLLKKLISDDTFRGEIIEHGYLRTKEFSWEKTAAITMREFKVLVKDKLDTSIKSENTLSVVEDAPRLIMDVTSTAQSPILSGIQRVMHNISNAMLDQNKTSDTKVVLSYSQNTKDWYQLTNLNKESVELSPFNRITYNQNDSYLLLDSSWTFLEGQGQRLTDALVMGQEVVHGVYDIGPLTMSAMTSEGMPPAFRRWIEFILGYSTGIVCISKAVADEMYQLIQDIKLPRPMKIGYFRLGADFSDAKPDVTELNFIKTRPTFLMVGTIEPRKGQYYGLKAFEQLWDRGVDVNLIIIGKAGWDTKMFQLALEHHPQKDKRLFWCEGVSDAGLAAAYDEADALIMTSYLEGFGLPVVEAGLQNTPVILSDLPVFREVGKGTPKASYFIPGSINGLAQAVEKFLNEELEIDFRDVDVKWPTWGESALELKEVVLNNNWYKYYEPEQVFPNVQLNDIGKVTLVRKLSEHETQHKLTIIEGPFLSDDGSHLRIAVAVKNNSNTLWSSNIGVSDSLGINLSYHLYDKGGDCIFYDNPRTVIPFVLPPGQEIIMPIRINSDCLTKGVYSAGIELVQEDVRWFGNEQKIKLTKPFVENNDIVELVPGKETKVPQLIYFRGPFGNSLNTEQYFLFSVINSDKYTLHYDHDSMSQFSYALIDAEGNKTQKGVWSVSHFDFIEAYNSGFISLFTDTQHIQNSKFLSITFKEHTWNFDLETKAIKHIKSQSKIHHKANNFHWIEKLVGKELRKKEILHSFSPNSPLTMRGFNAIEESHVWMADISGEIDINSLVDKNTIITQIKVVCSPLPSALDTIELRLSIGDTLLNKIPLSNDFMEYNFDIDIDNFKNIVNNNYRIKFSTNHHYKEENGERMLSICFANISLNILELID